MRGKSSFGNFHPVMRFPKTPLTHLKVKIQIHTYTTIDCPIDYSSKNIIASHHIVCTINWDYFKHFISIKSSYNLQKYFFSPFGIRKINLPKKLGLGVHLV
jgi:hypothetical protein